MKVLAPSVITSLCRACFRTNFSTRPASPKKMDRPVAPPKAAIPGGPTAGSLRRILLVRHAECEMNLKLDK